MSAINKPVVKQIQSVSWPAMILLAGIAANVAYAISSASTAFVPQDQPVGYVAQDDVTNFSLTSGNERIFRPDYEREFWSGNLFAYPVDSGGNINFSAEPWVGGAAAQLALQNWDSGRFIATRNAASPSAAIPFRYANLSASQQSYFPTSTINITSFNGDQIVNFLRGDRSNESPAGMRNRSAEADGTGGPTLGDIIHSRPFYVADATNPTIFVGANDGMLHAINATTGAERWAYIPSMLLNKMAKLAHPYGGLTNPHDYFVDGRINIRSIDISGTPTRILAGSLGAGGRGLYALNIEGSSGLAASSESDVVGKALWEIDGTTGKLNNATPTVSTAYNNLGFTYGAQAIAKVNAGGVDAIIAGNGYNNNPLGDYQAYLYVINAASGQLIARIQAGSGGSAASPNGIFSVAPIDINRDGKIDRVYAGDLKGTMWKFDLTNASAASWSVSALHTTSPAQPITSTPGVALHPSGGFMVTFGTGAMLDTADTTDSTVHYVYGIWDGAPVANTTLMTSNLEERNYVDGSTGATTRVRRSLNIQTPNWASGGDKGWVVALPAGEKLVGEGSFIASGRFYFTSHNPTVSTLSGASSVTAVAVTAGGSGYTTATVNFSGGGGSGASATATLSGGVITGIKVVSSGTGYTSAPTVTITGNGSGATATASLSSGTTVRGENWLMELDFLTGGSKDSPFLDLDNNQILNNGDRIQYIASDTLPGGAAVGDPIPGTDGIPVGKFLSYGVMSQPILVQLQTLNTTFFNRNADAIFPVNEITFGVTGGHFDVDIFYNGSTGNLCTTQTGVNVPAAKATAFITVGTDGQTPYLPATLGAITVDGVTVIPAQTIVNLPDGADTNANAATLKNAVAGGYTATVVGNVIQLTAPVAGTSYNGKVIVVGDGTSSPGSPGTPGTPAVPATYPTGLITFSGGKTQDVSPSSKIKADLSSGTASIMVGTLIAKATDISIGRNKDAISSAAAIVSAIGTSGTIKAYVGGSSITPTCAAMDNKSVCLVDTSTYVNGASVAVGTQTLAGTQTFTVTATAGGTPGSAAVPGTPATGWSNFKPALTVTTFSGGAAALSNVTVTKSCSSKNGNSDAHVHQYDDKYDRTGVDMLNPSSGTAHKLSQAITSTATKYKVLIHNQYLNPAVKFHIGDATYEPSLDVGYHKKGDGGYYDQLIAPTLDVATLPTYNGTSNVTGTSGTGFQPIGSLVFNMPTDALSAKDWWGNGDVRVGLHPINPGCGGRDGSTTDGNMYQPIIPPANGVDGPGINGWSASTVSLNSVGVRHGGALTIQLIKDTTPNSALELNDPLGRPEYGWRVKSADHAAYVLVEYTTYWHHPDNGCYGAAGWTKTPAADNGSSSPTTPAAGSTDPKLGDLSGTSGATVTSVARNVLGDVITTVITFSNGAQATITRTLLTGGDGRKTITTVTCDADGNCVTDVVHEDSADSNIVNGGDERGTRAHTGRVSWHELRND
ncbi:PilC/PilY family type IV pilus protein [Ferrigenium sp. UT5]|uniref:PilC/PilY family type IV pilus protein n=1 Tax=Ferrigenium sp. UT5 TaxID=3242105 RepID=UPI00354B9B45